MTPAELLAVPAAERLTPAQVAERLGVHHRTVRLWMTDGYRVEGRGRVRLAAGAVAAPGGTGAGQGGVDAHPPRGEGAELGVLLRSRVSGLADVHEPTGRRFRQPV